MEPHAFRRSIPQKRTLMTFLLFLAALALMEYIVNRKSPPVSQTTKETKEYSVQNAASSGLFSLAQAVDKPAGTPTDSTEDHKEVVHESGSDRV